jgi:hypothetical protein
MNPVSRIAPVSDADAARMVSPRTTADLAERIMATPTAAAAHTPSRHRPRHARRWAGGLAAAAALAVAALVVGSLGHPGQKMGPISVGPPKAEAAALSFTRHAGYIDVIVRNPVADPKTYAAEFAAHRMHITLQLVPVSPSLVGTVVYVGSSGAATGISTITARGRCWTGGAGSACPVGLRVPLGFHGTAEFAFGRAARPGEQYESTGSVTSRGEAMHGLAYRGRSVAAVLALLRARHVTVARYRYMYATGVPCGRSPSHVPGSWRVYSADPWARNQVTLWVGPPAGTHIPGCPTRIGTPQPNPTPSASPAASPAGR